MFEDIKDFFVSSKIPKFRVGQLMNAYFKQYITDFDDITVFPQYMRDNLNSKFKMCDLELVNSYESSDSVKFVFKTEDGNVIESVLILAGKRKTLCVSSQVFCPLNCKFCATGANKFKRDLTSKEILDQILLANSYLKKDEERVTNVVFMGMGEPFLNYNNVVNAVKWMNSADGFNIGARHITVSTVGIPEKIEEFSNLGLQVKLAISLHAATEEVRTSIMPINKKYSVADIMDATDEFSAKTNKKVSFEYVLIDGVNDSIKDAEDLVELMKGRLAFVNLLVYNPHEFADFKSPSDKKVNDFKRVLDANGIECCIRKSVGDDISGACGQLAAQNK